MDVEFNLQDENKLNISAENSKFNLLCLPVDNFPNFMEDFKGNGIALHSEKLLNLLNKTRISMSNDERLDTIKTEFMFISQNQIKLIFNRSN